MLTGHPFVRLDTTHQIPITPYYLITALVGRRTGQELAKVYDGQAREMAERRAAEPPDWQPARQPVPGVTPGSGQGRPPDQKRDAWIAGCPARLAAVQAEGGQAGRSLDLSPDSLEAFEEHVLQPVPD